MSSQTLIVALKGFKVRPQTLDKFLSVHGDVHGTQNGRYPPRYLYDNTGAASEKMSDILRARLTAIDGSSDSSGILAVVPSLYPHDRSPWVYVAYSHTFIYSQRLIPVCDLEKEAPRGFEQLRREILGCSSSPGTSEEGSMGFYVVVIGGRDGPLPAEFVERRKVLMTWPVSA